MSINDHICTMEDNMSKCCVLNFKTRKGNDYNNFVISVSFDGSKKNHDRNRVFSDGKGSFDTVYGNLKRFRENYPDYTMVRLLLVQDHFTDLLDNDRFFEENSGTIPASIPRSLSVLTETSEPVPLWI